jgi:hypothetical protein
MIDWWTVYISRNGPSWVQGGDGRRIVVPLRPGDSRAGRAEAIQWSQDVARGLAAQLNGPTKPKIGKEYA